MRRDRQAADTLPEVIAEGRARDRGAHSSAEAVANDDATERGELADQSRPLGEEPDLLGEIGDSLIQAHHSATRDGDPQTVSLIEEALFHVGRRLAHRFSRAEAWTLCH